MIDGLARGQTAFFRFVADTFFAKRYGHRAVVLETIAGVPGMVAGMWTHLRSLRELRPEYGEFITEMLAEAENERMHLVFFIELVRPTLFERLLIVLAQFVFWHYYMLMYIVSPRLAHRMVSYFEREAVRSYTEYLELIESGAIENVLAPASAVAYYGLGEGARLSDMIVKVRGDEYEHARVNFVYSV